MSAAQPDPPVHELRNGQECHYFTKKNQDGFQSVWVCDCGEMRDRFGRPMEARGPRLVRRKT